jgi:copper(I)-binding protein
VAAKTPDDMLGNAPDDEFVPAAQMPCPSALTPSPCIFFRSKDIMKFIQTATALLFSTLVMAPASMAQPSSPAVVVDGAWARASVPGQKGTGAFMKLTAKESMALVAAASPAAGVAEVHEMKMEGDVMKMRAVQSLDLPAGKTVELKPGGYHVMLMDLKAPLMKGSMVPITLTFKDAKGVETRLNLSVPVSVVAPGGVTAPNAHKH